MSGEWHPRDGASPSCGQQLNTGRLLEQNTCFNKGHQVGLQDNYGSRAVSEDGKEHDIWTHSQEPHLVKRGHTARSLLRSGLRTSLPRAILGPLQ